MYKVSGLLKIGLIYSVLFYLVPSVFADGLVVDQNGQVGVGTTNPLTRLHVEEPVSDYSQGTKITVNNSDISYWGEGDISTGIDFLKEGQLNGFIRVKHTREGGPHSYNDAGLVFGTAKSKNDAVERMVINHEGKVGIGTMEPLSALHVDGAVITGSGRGATTHNILNYFTYQKTTHHVHIKTPFNPNLKSETFHFKIRGYALRAQQIIDLTFVGYAYAKSKTLTNHVTLDPTGALNPIVYQGKDGYIYLRFTPANTYHMTLAVDSMYVGNGRILKAGDITKVVLSSSAKL